MKRSISRWVFKAVVAAMVLLPTMSFGATIRSTDIYAADGTSSQTLTTGNGIKTGHIQNGAVTNAKIFGNISGAKLMNNAITTAKIADSAVTDAKIAGSISGSKLAAGSVATAAIANGAITDSKITGPISGSKLGAHGHNASDIVGTISTASLPVGTIAGTVAAGDHAHDSIYQRKYANVIVVAKSGGDFTDPVAAMESINDASPSNPYLIKIMPGVYELASTIYVRANVDIEGSGEKSTILHLADGYPYYAIFVHPGKATEIRSLTLETNAPGTGYPTTSPPK